jgi:hypothetical protein
MELTFQQFANTLLLILGPIIICAVFGDTSSDLRTIREALTEELKNKEKDFEKWTPDELEDQINQLNHRKTTLYLRIALALIAFWIVTIFYGIDALFDHFTLVKLLLVPSIVGLGWCTWAGIQNMPSDKPLNALNRPELSYGDLTALTINFYTILAYLAVAYT